MSGPASCSTSNTNGIENNVKESGDEVDEIVKKKFGGFSSWVHCICVVTFDLELGQAIEVSYTHTFVTIMFSF